MAAESLPTIESATDIDAQHSRMMGLQEALPDLSATCVWPDGKMEARTLSSLASTWLLLVFYPRDFSFVCPTELTAFSDRLSEFKQRECEVVGISVDDAETHRRWLKTSLEEGGIQGLGFPLVSDAELRISRQFGILDQRTALAHRALFLFGPDQTLQYGLVHANAVGRSVNEALRVLDALRSGGLCPASWTAADGTLDLEKLLTKGRVLERFRLEERLGEGTFGSVFAARDLRLDRRVALKILRRREQTSWQTLLEEARSASRIQHPNVCTVYALEEIDGLSMIVMQHVEGEPLSRLIRRGLSEQQTIEFVVRIAAGIAAAHAMGVIHGDLKPGNVLIDSANNPVIVDFGLATVRETRRKQWKQTIPQPGAIPPNSEAADQVDQLQTLDLSSRPGIHGTPAYMSPEQSRGEPLCASSDIFSLGLLLFEMLTGERAVPGKNIVEILTNIQQPGIGNGIANRAPALYQSLLRQMLTDTSSERISIDAVCDALLPLQ